jgi:hypothetical protein
MLQAPRLERELDRSFEARGGSSVFPELGVDAIELFV